MNFLIGVLQFFCLDAFLVDYMANCSARPSCYSDGWRLAVSVSLYIYLSTRPCMGSTAASLPVHEWSLLVNATTSVDFSVSSPLTVYIRFKIDELCLSVWSGAVRGRWGCTGQQQDLAASCALEYQKLSITKTSTSNNSNRESSMGDVLWAFEHMGCKNTVMQNLAIKLCNLQGHFPDGCSLPSPCISRCM